VLAVLDTNVLISALLFRGRTAIVHEDMLRGILQALVSADVLAEYSRVLAYDKFGLSEEDVAYLLNDELIPYCTMCPDPPSGENWIQNDPSDNCFVDLARSVPGCVLISGDRHIVHRRDTLPCKVLTVAEFLADRPG
jgi:putative PIN family toxin of toxin-antitoxin system